MWIYEKSLQHTVRVSRPNVKFAKLVVAQYGGPNGELSASLQYLNQRYSMPDPATIALLTDIGTEELGHMEMIAALVYQLTEGASAKEFEEAGWGTQYVQHDHGVFWTDTNGVPWSAKYVATLGDPIADLVSNMAAEQNARVTYEHLIDMTDDNLARDTLRFLWEREVVHFQRFGEALNNVQQVMNKKTRVWTGKNLESK